MNLIISYSGGNATFVNLAGIQFEVTNDHISVPSFLNTQAFGGT